MDEDVMRFLQQQIIWAREQDLLLAKIEGKLRAMRALAEYRLASELNSVEIQALNQEIEQLRQEVKMLECELENKLVH